MVFRTALLIRWKNSKYFHLSLSKSALLFFLFVRICEEKHLWGHFSNFWSDHRSTNFVIMIFFIKKIIFLFPPNVGFLWPAVDAALHPPLDSPHPRFHEGLVTTFSNILERSSFVVFSGLSVRTKFKGCLCFVSAGLRQLNAGLLFPNGRLPHYTLMRIVWSS